MDWREWSFGRGLNWLKHQNAGSLSIGFVWLFRINANETEPTAVGSLAK